MKATAMGPLDVHLALADVPAKAESLEVIWFDLDPAVAASPAKALAASCSAFKVSPQFAVAATPVWLPALEGLRAIDERPVAGFTSKSLEVGGLAACDLQLLAESTHVRARVIGSGFRIYQLVVISDGDEPPAADVAAFFAGFHAHPPPAPPPRARAPAPHHDAFTTIVTGAQHTCALDANGQPWCWGLSSNGQLGTDSDSAVPRPLAAGTHVRTLAAGSHQTCAILDDDQLRCWGRVTDELPERSWAVVGLPSPVRSIALGGAFDCVSLVDGTIWCWGANALGQLGARTPKVSKVPIQVDLKGGAAVEVSAGAFHTCARQQDGSVWCWGDTSPPARVMLGASADQIAAGGTLSCARTSDGAVWCWGQIGITYNHSEPVKMALPAAAAQVAVGNQFACARLADGSIWCWGGNVEGQLGYADRCDAYPRPSDCERAAPRKVPLPASASLLATGDSHACALTGAGQVWCWGYGVFGQLGNGAKDSSPKPVRTK